MLPHIPATIHPAHRIERTFPQSAKLKEPRSPDMAADRSIPPVCPVAAKSESARALN